MPPKGERNGTLRWKETFLRGVKSYRNEAKKASPWFEEDIGTNQRMQILTAFFYFWRDTHRVARNTFIQRRFSQWGIPKTPHWDLIHTSLDPSLTYYLTHIFYHASLSFFQEVWMRYEWGMNEGWVRDVFYTSLLGSPLYKGFPTQLVSVSLFSRKSIKKQARRSS